MMDAAQVVTVERFVPRPAAEASAVSPSALAPQSLRFKTAAAFCGEYVPLRYAIEPIVRSSALYTLTAKTGAGKTAWLVVTALAIATGRNDLLGVDVSKGRVAYLAFENPDDVRMRLMAAAYLLNVDLREVGERLVICDLRAKPEEVIARLAAMSDDGQFGLVIADTLAAFFDGKDINDNVQGGEFMRRLRPITALPGQPSAIVAAHPVKNATDEQLVPYGGGAILNEVDGNLTLSFRPETKLATLHWQGKLRGLEFTPKTFRLQLVESPDIVDAKGRSVSLPVMRPLTDAEVDAAHAAEEGVEVALLRVMAASPNASQAAWGDAIGKPKSTVNRVLNRLKVERVVEVTMGKWSVTPKGQKAAGLQTEERNAEAER